MLCIVFPEDTELYSPSMGSEHLCSQSTHRLNQDCTYWPSIVPRERLLFTPHSLINLCNSNKPLLWTVILLLFLKEDQSGRCIYAKRRIMSLISPSHYHFYLTHTMQVYKIGPFLFNESKSNLVKSFIR